eukprot:CAMPEP_0172297738 /NCGR_PEP_ID=MMETSP1058-20130122/653_1 /TAXON_ID=83371 /ORGANISM="Detonula confervacea, Strain CCMP 353" /LENGTH=181 /DNA_ID=CAMNT_0013006923 /DNA_START=30 /DNA_END=575 /DNA_ORIENTATION=+
MTKLTTLATILLTASSATAFSTSRPGNAIGQQHTSQTSTTLNLFGSKPKSDDSAGGPPAQPGMMDQLAMFKKAQELASKKNAIDKELAEEKIIGTAADGNIKITVQYIPPQLPANPSPGFESDGVEIDADYLESVSAEDLSASLVDAIRDGESKASEIVQQKYKVLEEDMKAIMGGGAPSS